MLLIALLLAAAPVQTPTGDAYKRDEAYCQSSANDQPRRFCLAEREHIRAEATLARLLLKARRAALAQRLAIRRFSKEVGGVTLGGDPVAALDAAQKAWEKSYAADCLLFGLSSATGNAGTEGVTANYQCEADRIAERGRFLKSTFALGD